VSRKRFEWASVVYDTHKRGECPNRWCRVHYFFNFQTNQHEMFPYAWRLISSIYGWKEVTVFCGPGAWEPKRPLPSHWSQMALVCPHDQMSLTCNYCQRHTFHPYEV
jgi:hypothetical protein